MDYNQNQNPNQNQNQMPNPNQNYYPNPYNTYGQMPQGYNQNPVPMTVKDWLLTFLLLCIPFVNIVLVFVWAFSSSTNPSKASFFKAYLVMMLIGIALAILFGGMMVAFFADSMNYYY